MKNVTFTLFLSFVFPCFAFSQTKLPPLTVREVFDFNAGDVFDYEDRIYSQSTKKVRWQIRDSIMDKTVLGDIWIYTKAIKVKTDENELLNYIVKDTIRHLDSSIFTQLPKLSAPSTPANWLITKDSTYNTTEYGGGIMSAHSVGIILNISQNYQVRFFYMKGLGKVFDLESDYYPVNQGTRELTTTMVYYKKGTATWGTSIDFTIVPKPYEPMAVEGAKWIYCANPNFICLAVKGDSSVANIAYKKLWEYELSPPKTWGDYTIKKSRFIGLIRDDAKEEKVYYRYLAGNYPPEGCQQQSGNDILLYDFKVKPNDTLSWCQFGNTKGIVRNKSINLPFRDKFITTGFNMGYVGNLNGNLVLERIGFAGDGLFYKMKDFCSFCVGTGCHITVGSNDVLLLQEISIVLNDNVLKIPCHNFDENKPITLRCHNAVGQLVYGATNEFSNATFETQNIDNQLIIISILQNEKIIGQRKIAHF